MGLFSKKKNQPKSQREMAKEALLRGETLDMMTMLFDYGIGNHTGVIAEVRKDFEREGKGYDYVKTRFVQIKAKKTGRKVRVARYYIPKEQ